MRCPVDDTVLVMTERHGCEIDYCPTCRGVWLDRGELDKIIEQATPPAILRHPAAQPLAPERPPRDETPYQSRAKRRAPRDDDDDDDDDDRRERRGRRKRGESFLSDLFDF